MSQIRRISLRLTDKEYEFVNTQAENIGLSKAEYIKLILWGVNLAEEIQNSKKSEIKLKVGEYGYNLKKEQLKEFAIALEKQFVGLEKAIEKVNISEITEKKRVRYKELHFNPKVPKKS